jgi:hypothetical protein
MQPPSVETVRRARVIMWRLRRNQWLALPAFVLLGCAITGLALFEGMPFKFAWVFGAVMSGGVGTVLALALVLTGGEQTLSRVLRQAVDPAGPELIAELVSPNAGLCLVRHDGVFTERPLRFVPYEETPFSVFGELTRAGEHALELRWRARAGSARGGTTWLPLSHRIELPPAFSEAQVTWLIDAVRAIAVAS